MRRLLVVQTAFLGDIVLTTPLLRELKRVEPESSLTVVTTPLGRAILEGHPFVDEVIAYDKKGSDRGPRGVLRLVARLRRERFDAAVAAQRSSRTGLVVRGSGAATRVGFADAAGRWAYTHRVPWDGGRHAVHRYLALAAPVGGDPERAPAQPVLTVTARAQEKVAGLLAASGIGPTERILAIAPGSIWGTKRWTPEGFATVARRARDLGFRPVLVGSPDEAALCGDVARLAGVDVPVLAGTTGPSDLVALLARAALLLSNDSGPGHVASAVGTPVVAIFGPTVPAFGYTPFGPLNRIVEVEGLACRPCDRHGPQVCPLKHHRCMNDLPAARVVAAVQDALGSRS